MRDATLRERARRVRLLVLDVDGVMTDGSIVLDGRGGESKRFHVRDGVGIALARAAGIEVAIVTGRTSAAVAQRAAELRIAHLIEGAQKKGAALDGLLAKTGVAAEEVAYVGDDLPDLPPLTRVGLPLAVADACDEVRALAAHVARAKGGAGAIRELVEWLLDLREERGAARERFLRDHP